jgi:hypothetical protein
MGEFEFLAQNHEHRFRDDAPITMPECVVKPEIARYDRIGWMRELQHFL